MAERLSLWQVRGTAKLFQRYARTYLAHQKMLDWKDVDDPELTPAKKREVCVRIVVGGVMGVFGGRELVSRCTV